MSSWIYLTTVKGDKIAIDFDKVTSFVATPNGTKVDFTNVVTNAKGEQVFKSVAVSDPADRIAKILRAKSA